MIVIKLLYLKGRHYPACLMQGLRITMKNKWLDFFKNQGGSLELYFKKKSANYSFKVLSVAVSQENEPAFFALDLS